MTAFSGTITRLFWNTDQHDWEGLQEVLHDPVVLGYTAVWPRKRLPSRGPATASTTPMQSLDLLR